jgi:hypothetical protein
MTDNGFKFCTCCFDRSELRCEFCLAPLCRKHKVCPECPGDSSAARFFPDWP